VAREHYGWDLAQLCIDTCGQPIEKLVAANSGVLHTDREPSLNVMGSGSGAPPRNVTANCSVPPQQTIGTAEEVNELITFPLDLDIPWDYLWDDMIEPWPVNTHGT